MLARTVMSVVFVLNEKISSGTGNGDGGEMDFKGQSILKSATETSFAKDAKMKRGKPLKLETQILVGERLVGETNPTR